MKPEPLKKAELKTTTGFSLLPSTLVKLDVLTVFLNANRSRVIEHLIQSAYSRLPDKD